HCGRPRHRAGADLHRARRADERARYADPVADRRPSARSAETARSDVSIHLARPVRCRGAIQQPDRDASWQGGGSGPGRRAFRPSQNRLYPRLVRGGFQPRDGAGRRRRSIDNRKGGPAGCFARRGDRIAMSNILVSTFGWDPKGWDDRFRALAPQHGIYTWPENPGDPSAIQYACVWNPPRGLLAGFPNLKAVFSLGAGVDELLADPKIPDVPIVRIVDSDLTMRMT